MLLGNKNCGKRTFLNQLTEISKTKFPTKSSFFCFYYEKETEMQFNKFGGLDEATAYSYTYLNVINLEDEENGKFIKLLLFF